MTVFGFGRTSASVVTVLIFCLFVSSLLIVSKGAWKGGNDPATYQWAPCLISGITCVCRIIESDAELTEESKTCGAGRWNFAWMKIGWRSPKKWDNFETKDVQIGFHFEFASRWSVWAMATSKWKRPLCWCVQPSPAPGLLQQRRPCCRLGRKSNAWKS